MVIRLDPKTEFFTKLEKLYKIDKIRDAVFNALYFIYHPLSSSYERPYEEKKINAQRNLLTPVGVKLEDLDKTLVSLFISDCISGSFSNSVIKAPKGVILVVLITPLSL